ncbi:adhesion G protein-coupled receptor E3-like [Rhinoraja longicauda]
MAILSQGTTCSPGFQVDPKGNNQCTDINECASCPCVRDAACYNTAGCYWCICNAGFNSTTDSIGKTTCEDIDECKSSPCGKNTLCDNAPGSYQCNCIAGFRASAGTTGIGAEDCEDVDECERGHQCSGNMTCRNTFGSYICVCGAGSPPGTGQTHKACQVDPLNCSDLAKQSSTEPWCSSTQLTSADDVLQKANCFKDKMCRDFSVESGIEVMETFTSKVLNRSLLNTINIKQRLEMVTAILDLVDNLAMAIALTLPSSQVKTIATHSFVLKVQVIGKKNNSGDHLVEMQVGSNVMKIFWSSITGGTNPGFVAVSFLVFNDMESLLNREIKGGIPTQRTVPLNSKVVSATVSNKSVSSKLEKMVNFTMKLNQPQEQQDNEKPTCVFWKTMSGDSVWSHEGCTTHGFNQTHVNCQCGHLTSFAVLMAPVNLEDALPLEVITYICLIVSLLCLAASIAIFLKCSSIQNANTTVHKHLSFTLFLAQFVFLIGMRIKHKVVCGLIAGCLHYLFLTVFAWMFLESLQLFIMSRHLTVTNYTRTHVIKRKYLYVSSYGVPAVIVVISVAINPKGYGSENHCWLSLERGFRWGFLGPVCLVIVVNTVLLAWTLGLLRKHFASRNKEVSKLKETRTLTLKAAARLLVLGTTWLLGIFQLNESTLAMSYLFTIINSLQGLFVFLIYCVFNRQVTTECRKWLDRKHKHFTTESSQIQMTSTEVTIECRKWLDRKHMHFTTESSQIQMTSTET